MIRRRAVASVDALASDRSDQSFGEAVLPRRAWSDRFVADPHGSQSMPDGNAIDLIPIADQVARGPKMLRVGFVGMQPREAPHYANFLKRMAEPGYQEGRNFTIDYIQTPNVEVSRVSFRHWFGKIEPSIAANIYICGALRESAASC
jgi:hypothetical protein